MEEPSAGELTTAAVWLWGARTRHSVQPGRSRLVARHLPGTIEQRPLAILAGSHSRSTLSRQGHCPWRTGKITIFHTPTTTRRNQNLSHSYLAPARSFGSPGQIGADLRDDRLTVAIGGRLLPRAHVAISPPPHVCEQLQRYRGFAISLTAKALPALLALRTSPAPSMTLKPSSAWVTLTPAAAAVAAHGREPPGLKANRPTG